MNRHLYSNSGRSTISHFPYAIWGTKFPFLYELACHPRSTCIPPAMHCPISSIAQF